MHLREKRTVMDASGIENALRKLSEEMAAERSGPENLVLVGIRTRGVYLAGRLKKLLEEKMKAEVPLGILDITLYRDDLTSIGPNPVVNKTVIPFDVTGKKIILVDDVFYTGRTMRAALDEIMDFGRPALVRIAVLVDRGRRELPIHPDFTGVEIETLEDETVAVSIAETDGSEKISVLEKA